MKLLTCENLKVGYDKRKVLENVNLEINTGDYVCLVGSNGSGKSTLIKTMLHLIAPLDGNVRFEEGLKNNSIGYLPQEVNVPSNFPASVIEVVLSGRIKSMTWHPFYNKRDRALANHYIKLFDIHDIKYKPFCDLSGGQQQRVLIARALCATEKILFLDEPFAALDIHTINQVNQTLKRINREKEIAIVMITHDVEEAMKYVNKVVHVENTVVFVGTPTDYLESEIGKDYMGGVQNVKPNK